MPHEPERVAFPQEVRAEGGDAQEHRDERAERDTLDTHVVAEHDGEDGVAE